MGDEATQLRPRLSLWEIADRLKSADDGLTGDIDLTTLGEITRDKVDALRRVDEGFQSEDARLSDEIKRLQDQRKTLRNQYEAFKGRVVEAMQHGEFTLLSGKTSAVRLQANPPSLVVEKEPDASDYEAHRDYVEATLSYRWKKDVIKARLQEGVVIPWARLETGSHVRFVPRKG